MPIPDKKPEKFPHKGRAGFLARKKLAEEGKSIKPKNATGWGGVAQWYHDTVEDKESYQSSLILPNIVRLVDAKKGETILDLACGEGFFARRFEKSGSTVIGVDIAKELIAIAQKTSPTIKYFVSGADHLPFIPDGSVDKITIILALQNIENVHGVFAECARVLKKGGKLFFVLNHPTFRIPKQSGWGWAAAPSVKPNVASGEQIQYRRIDKYMSELREKIAMHPGDKPSEMTISFHRPLQFYFKALGKAGLAVTNMEEWVSPKKSMPGPRADAENRGRTEIPLFMTLEVVKL